ncbi:MAG: hypothetical protein U0935_18960 [Pirellulales bacterium]
MATPNSREPSVGIGIIDDASGDTRLEEEDVVLQIRGGRVPPDDIGQRGPPDLLQFSPENRVRTEAVSITKPLELVDESAEGRPDARRNMILGQPADPQIDIVHVAVGPAAMPAERPDRE